MGSDKNAHQSHQLLTHAEGCDSHRGLALPVAICASVWWQAQTFLLPHFLHHYLQTESPLCILYTVWALPRAVWGTRGLNKGGDNPGACKVCRKAGKVREVKNIHKRLECVIRKRPGSINLKQFCFRLLFSARHWRERAKRQKLNFNCLSFLCDCHLLNVPIYFLHESLVLDLPQLSSRKWSLAVHRMWGFSLLVRLQAILHKANSFVIPIGLPP